MCRRPPATSDPRSVARCTPPERADIAVAERLRRSTGELTAWEHAHPPQQPTNGATGIPCIEIDGQPRVASASDDATVRVWDPASGATVTVLAIMRPCHTVALRRDRLAIGTDRGVIGLRFLTDSR